MKYFLYTHPSILVLEYISTAVFDKCYYLTGWDEYQDQNNNGIHWTTMIDTLRRDGVYNSKTYGEIDCIQELCDPMEREYTYKSM